VIETVFVAAQILLKTEINQSVKKETREMFAVERAKTWVQLVVIKYVSERRIINNRNQSGPSTPFSNNFSGVNMQFVRGVKSASD
jgi:hypothetical protein